MPQPRKPAPPPSEARKGQEGSRWINERPSGADVASWFKENVKLHEGLSAEDYVTGITLIPANEKTKEVIGYRDNNSAIIEERQNVVYTPYPRVDTRIKYFHDLMAANADEWYGVIEPIEVPRPRSSVLPPGFFHQRVQNKKGDVISFIGCTMKVTVWKRDGFEETFHHQTGTVRRTGVRVIDAPPATKIVALTNGYGDADTFAMMKAETGAIGRALGMAGMLVVPGAGVATAEDIGEVDQPPPQGPTTADDAAGEPTDEPGNGPTDDELRAQAAALIQQLQDNAPDKLAEFQAWAKDRNMGLLSETVSPALRGVVRQLERKVDEAIREMGDEPDEAQAQPTTEMPAVAADEDTPLAG